MLTLYKEVLVSLEPSKQSTVTDCQVPAASSWALTRSTRSKQGGSFTDPEFESSSLASNASIYFRQAQTYPRCFAWRILDDGHILELRSVDLIKSRLEEQDASQILRLQFPSPIIPTAVAFADSEGQDYIHGFVITETKELYTLTLRREYFTDRTSTPQDFSRACVPSYFTLHRPFKLHAHSPYELFVSYENGTLQRLSRKAEDDGSNWVQHTFDERAWSFGALVKWQGRQSVKHDGRTLDQATATAITALSDSTHAFTVCLNHTLRVWNLTTGHLVLTKDLLDMPPNPQETPVLMNPAANTNVRLVKLGFSGQTYVVTFSPYSEGYFKFWTVKNPLTSQLELTDAFPSASLKAPDPDPSGNSLWSLTSFEVLPTDSNNIVEIWILWRNNNVRQLVSTKLNLMDVQRSWNNDWVQTAVHDYSSRQSVELVQDDTLDLSSRWLEYLLRPELYSQTLLETALTTYQDILKFKLSGAEKRATLAQRLTSTVMSNVNIRRYAAADMDYDRFEADLDKQWQNIWRIAENLRERQSAPIALVLDPYNSMPWVVMADYCAAIRESTDIELLTDNVASLQDNTVLENHWSHRKIAEDGMDKISTLLKMASSFRQRLSSEALAFCRTTLEADIFQKSELPLPTQIVTFYDTCNFGTEVSDEAYDIVLKHLDSFGGFQGLTNEIFYALLDKFPENVSKPESQLVSSNMGQEFVAAGARDVIRHELDILIELFLLVVFLECEVNAEDSQHPDFNSPELVAQLQILLREYSKKYWLASHYRTAAQKSDGEENALSQSKPDRPLRSLLHDLFVQDIRPQPAAGIPQSFTLTQCIEDVIAWTREHDSVSFEDGLVHIQCGLLLNGDLELAQDFLRYQPSTAWSTYVKGRFYLESGDFDVAASYFQKAAHLLARGKAIGDIHESSAGLLSIVDAECFNNGLPKYFQHVSALFEGMKCYSQAVMFVQLALQALPFKQAEAHRTLKQDLLARLFTANIKCQKHRSAFMALSRYTDGALQENAMATLVKAIFASPDPTSDADRSMNLLLSLPIGSLSGLTILVDKTLIQLAYKAQYSTEGSPSARIERAVQLLNVLHSYRLSLKNFPGVVQVLLHQMSLVRQLLEARSDEDALDLRNILLTAINALSCAPSEEAYVLQDAPGKGGSKTGDENMADGEPAQGDSHPQMVLTLRELRQEYQLLLDRHSRIERGDFDFAMDGDN